MNGNVKCDNPTCLICYGAEPNSASAPDTKFTAAEMPWSDEVASKYASVVNEIVQEQDALLKAKQLKVMADLPFVQDIQGPMPLTDEAWREYDFGNGIVYHIDNPVALYIRTGGTTHRVVDSDGVVHAIPFPLAGDKVAVLRWMGKTGVAMSF